MGFQFWHGSPHMVDHTPGGAVAAGDGVVINGKVQIAHKNIAAGELGALAVPSGSATYKLDKAAGAGDTFTKGDDVPLNVGAMTGDPVGTANVGLTCAQDAADADNYVLVVHGA